VLTCSSLKNHGLDAVWDVIGRFRATMTASGHLESNRRRQSVDWIHSLVEQELWQQFTRNPAIAAAWPGVEQDVLGGKLSPTAAARRLFNASKATNP
jgi:LAO/AO transport system kinase